jgi:glycosyltransferase involved in cell wall biosynthesis
MRISIVTEFFPKSEKIEIRGGAESRAFHVAKHLAKAHEVTVLTTREYGTDKMDEFLGIKVMRLGRERRYSQKGSWLNRLSFILEGMKVQNEFDLIDGHSFVSYPLAWDLSKKQQIPAIATYHDVWIGRWIKHMEVMGVFGELLERYVLSRNWKKYIVVSGFVQSLLMKHGIDKDRIEIIPNGIEIEKYEKLKVSKFSRPTICCISRLVEYKHVNDILKALVIVKKEIPDISCKIIGTGPEEMRLKSLATKLGLKNRVEFLGFIPNHVHLAKILKSSHVLCLASSVEGFGIVLLEAIASRVPFVASKIPPLVETTGGKGGLFFRSRDYKNLADKLVQILKNKSLQKKCIQQGSRVIQKYEWRSITKKIEEVYERCLE